MVGLAELEGRTAVVTGAASGIGLAVTEAFVAAGMRVLMTDVDDALLASHAERLADGGAEVRALAVDVTDPDAVERAGRRRGRALREAARRGQQRRHRRAGQLLGAAALRMAPRDRRRPLGCDPRDPRVRAPHPRVGRARARGEHRVDGRGDHDPCHRALHRVEARRARPLRRLARRARGDRRTHRCERGDARHDQDRRSTPSGRWDPSRWRPTWSMRYVAVARTCSPTTTTSRRSSRVWARSSPHGRRGVVAQAPRAIVGHRSTRPVNSPAPARPQRLLTGP